MAWKHLIDIALLGTDKKKIDVRSLPEEIKTFMELRHAGDNEMQLLEASALSFFYEEAGQQPAKFSGTWNEEIIVETKEIAPSPFLDLLSKIKLEEHHNKEHLLNHWLDALLHKEKNVAAEHISSLLTEGNNLSALTKSKIVQVIGNRGLWALDQTSYYNYKKQPSGESLWQDGSTTERKNLFAALHQSNPTAAIELLESTWSTESIINKKAFLEILLLDSKQADVPFAQRLLDTEFVYQTKEKKTEKECRLLLVKLLLKYPASSLSEKTRAQIAAYFLTQKKGITGWITGKPNVALTLPAEEDPFFSSQHVEQVYGLESKNIDSALFQTKALFYMAFFLEVIPFDFWMSFFNGNEDHTIDFFLDSDQYKSRIEGKSVAVFRHALFSNMKNHHDSVLAKALTGYVPPSETLEWSRHLDRKEFEAFIEKNNYYNEPLMLHGDESPWSPAFSQKVLSNAYEINMQTKLSHSIGHVISRFAHHSLLAPLLTYHEQLKKDNSPAYDTWNRIIFATAYNALDIRKKIEDYKLS